MLFQGTSQMHIKIIIMIGIIQCICDYMQVNLNCPLSFSRKHFSEKNHIFHIIIFHNKIYYISLLLYFFLGRYDHMVEIIFLVG
jgi:hypothetical protein